MTAEAPKRHRHRTADITPGARFTVTHGAVSKTVTQYLCGACGQSVTFRYHGYGRGAYVHGEEKG